MPLGLQADIPELVIMCSFIILSTDGWLFDYVRVMLSRCVYMAQHMYAVASEHILLLQ